MREYDSFTGKKESNRKCLCGSSDIGLNGQRLTHLF